VTKLDVGNSVLDEARVVHMTGIAITASMVGTAGKAGTNDADDPCEVSLTVATAGATGSQMVVVISP